jgi:hypothetical protein
MTNDARESGVQRLAAAVLEQERLDKRYEAAQGTSSEFGAYVRLRGANDEVAARQAWLDLIDDGQVGGRAWVNGREIGGTDPRFLRLEESHD